MAFKHESSYDTLDLDRYIDFEQAVYPSPTSSTTSRGKAIATPEFVAQPASRLVHTQPTQQTIFAGPSHEYDNYKQTTGLPLGGLANTLAANQPGSLSTAGYQSGYNVPPLEGFFRTSTVTDDLFDFNSFPSLNHHFANPADMEMDFDSPDSGLFTPTATKDKSVADYVDPNAIGGQEDQLPISPPAQSSVGRLWPGMHQQQAAMAKAQAQQQKQQQSRAAPTLQPVAPSHRQAAPRSSSSSSRPPNDPIVEERISRLLNQMRHNSDASSLEEDDKPSSDSQHHTHLARQQKEEEDMDEDERLLASEEGKKLSSKERRQLRNKVSARAFRSRRKEYIGQLEGELATKGKEADDLRTENEALKAENTRLTDLTRMLLSSAAFSSFLNDLSNNTAPNGTAPVSAPAAVPTPSAVAQPTPVVRKDANPHQRQLPNLSHGNAQVGMTLIPESPMDFSVFDPAGSTWGGMDFGFNNAQVFSVTELPVGPAIDVGLLSGKSSNTVGSYPSEDGKVDAPVIERMPQRQDIIESIDVPAIPCDDVDFDETDPAFALFVDGPAVGTPVPTEIHDRIFGSIEPEKAFARYDLAVDDGCDVEGIVSSAVMARFERACLDMEAASRRVAAATAHL